MKIEKLSTVERESLYPARTEEWGGLIAPEELSGRCKHLYSLPYGKDKITTYGLKKDGKIVASMDIMQVPLMGKKQDKAELIKGYLLAWCIVPKEFRKNGYAKELLKQFTELETDRQGVLYSDIGPNLYSPYGFVPRKSFVVEGPEKNISTLNVTPLSLEEFVSSLRLIREKELLSHAEGATCIAPDTEFFSWQIERFKYTALVRKKDFPVSVAFKINHGTHEHILLTAPNLVKNRQEGLWVTSGCVLCEEVLASQAHANGLKSYAYWDLIPPMHVKDVECPMVKTGMAQSLFIDPQLIDWC